MICNDMSNKAASFPGQLKGLCVLQYYKNSCILFGQSYSHQQGFSRSSHAVQCYNVSTTIYICLYRPRRQIKKGFSKYNTCPNPLITLIIWCFVCQHLKICLTWDLQFKIKIMHYWIFTWTTWHGRGWTWKSGDFLPGKPRFFQIFVACCFKFCSYRITRLETSF